MTHVSPIDGRAEAHPEYHPLRHGLLIGTISFLTLVDLFAAQAILPALTRAYGVGPAEMGVAVNASTFGMAAAGLTIALIGRHLNRAQGIWVSLACLTVPTLLLAHAQDLTQFTALRVIQGVFMASAFSLTMTYLAERPSYEDTASALAAYITGNVASNLFGRLLSASLADQFGLEINFYVFAALNLGGALLVYLTLQSSPRMIAMPMSPRPALRVWGDQLMTPHLAASFATGFLILFVFIGIFTYVNFALTAPPVSLSPMQLGTVYFVFLPAMLVTPLAGRLAAMIGVRLTVLGAFVVALAGLPLLVTGDLSAILVGLALAAAGTFFAQAAATGFVSKNAGRERAAASGLYLSSYYLGGLIGSAILGQIYVSSGWTSTVAAIGIALILAMICATRLMPPRTP